MKVIGAGFGRTGTLSLKVALELLGFGKCYHMKSVIKRPKHIRAWRDAGRDKPVDWDYIFKKFNATVDFPASLFYDEPKTRYPDAKIILTVRDTDSWYQSTVRTIYRVPSTVPVWLQRIIPPMGQFIEMTDLLIWDGLFKGRFSNKEFASRVYQDHIQNVRQTVPEEDLLIFDVKDGWGPLCDFLGVGIPENRPFPHLNTSNRMIMTLYFARLMPYVLVTLAVITVGLLFFVR